MSSPIILFDGVCNLCNGAVQFIIKNDTDSVFKFSSLQSTYSQAFLARNNLPLDIFDTLVLVENDRYFTKSEAVFKILKHLPKYQWLGFLSFLPTAFTDFFYDLISKNRLNWFGKRNECWIPTKELESKFLA
jgi:predicted DCC family thiol-disulfide oxidoreductase YuxK